MMYEKILHLLKNSDGYVSGQTLCEQFHVSRTAIWKYMNGLKEAGYVIDSVSNKGYRLLACPDLVNEAAIRSSLETKWMGHEIVFYEETDSTNVRAKILGEEGKKSGVLVIAEQQTGGKGRRGRGWVSPKRTGIFMSLMLRPEILARHASMLTLVSAVAVAKGINEIGNIECTIKWPNDIIINGKKVCGILTEMSTDMEEIQYVVVGMGINVNNKEFPQEIQSVATSLFLETGKEVERAKLVAGILKQFESYYGIFEKDQDLSGILSVYNEMLINKNRQVRIIEEGKERTGLALGIDKEGALLVQRENGAVERVIAGEVSVRGIYGYV